MRGLLNSKKQAAKQRGLDWCISFEKFKEITTLPCHWCGIEPFERYNVGVSKNGYTQRLSKTEQITDGWITYNGLDRVDNDLGYTEDNVLPCCKWCNFARNVRTVEEFMNWIERLKAA